jgi:hypothetical protein
LARKPDDSEIGHVFDALPAELRLDSRRAWWPKYFFRFDDIETVANILTMGMLYSRAECTVRGIEHRDAANQDVIRNSSEAHRYVRLYFRPLTPTQFHMEGIKASEQISPTLEHCPVPVFLLFDSKKLAGTVGVQFTNGGAANTSRVEYGSTAEFLRTIPFESVYHTGGISGDQSERREIVFRRHAEILIERELPLDALVRIVCRSGPERDTLLYLLGSKRAEFEPFVILATAGIAMFNRNGMYVESIRLVGTILYVGTPPRSLRYHVDVLIEPVAGGRARRATLDNASLRDLRLDLKDRVASALVTIRINGCLAYKGVVSQEQVVG